MYHVVVVEALVEVLVVVGINPEFAGCGGDTDEWTRIPRSGSHATQRGEGIIVTGIAVRLVVLPVDPLVLGRRLPGGGNDLRSTGGRDRRSRHAATRLSTVQVYRTLVPINH